MMRHRTSRTVTLRAPLALVLTAALLCLCMSARGQEEQAAGEAAKPGAGAAPAVRIGSFRAIVTGANPSALEQQAAGELSRYLERMYGESLAVEARGDVGPETTGVILLGTDAALAARAVSAAELDEVGWDGYVVKVAADRVVVAGRRGRATLYGVAGLLERLGARFYGVVEVIPDLKGEPVEPFSLSDKPAFEFRRLLGGWTLKAGRDDLSNARSFMEPEIFKEGGVSFDHVAGYLVPPPLYYEEHPEYYALYRGKRIFRTPKGDRRKSYVQTVLCLSHPNVTRIAAERMNAWMDKDPERRFFPCTYGDTSVLCECDECRKLDTTPGQYTDRLLHWVNGVARAVRAKHPDKVLVAWAYVNRSAAPRRERPEPNVLICVSPWYGLEISCRKHPYTLCWRSVVSGQHQEGWFKWSPQNVGYYDYCGIRPQLQAIEHRMRFAAKRGIGGYFQLSQSRKFTALEQFVKAKLAWDPSLDPAKLEEEFCGVYYGPELGPLMLEHLRAWYHEFVGAGTHRPRGDPQYPGRALDLLRRIEAAASEAGEPYRQRAMGDLDGFHQAESSYKEYGELKEPARYRCCYGGSLELFKEWMRSCVGKGISGAEFVPIEPEPGYQNYGRDSLWLSEPRIDRNEFADDAKLTHITAILAPGDERAGRQVKETLKAIYGIDLPLEATMPGRDTRGVVVVGRRAALACGSATEADFAAARDDGAVVRALDGRLTVAASRQDNTGVAIELLLHVLRSRHGGKALGDEMPKAEVPIVRAFTMVDWPPFGAVYGP